MTTTLEYAAGIMKFDEQTKRVLADSRAGKLKFIIVK